MRARLFRRVGLAYGRPARRPSSRRPRCPRSCLRRDHFAPRALPTSSLPRAPRRALAFAALRPSAYFARLPCFRRISRIAFCRTSWGGSRERSEEIPLFSNLIVQSRGQAAALRLGPLLVERLCTCNWPFNVPEMVQLVHAILALYPAAAVLDGGLLAKLSRAEGGIAASQKPSPPTADEGERQAFELKPEQVLAVLKENGGSGPPHS
jgi:hypothetical protein